MEDSQEGQSCEIISWVYCEVDEQLQNELAVRFYVSLQCVSCELKFFTGIVGGQRFKHQTAYLIGEVRVVLYTWNFYMEKKKIFVSRFPHSFYNWLHIQKLQGLYQLLHIKAKIDPFTILPIC